MPWTRKGKLLQAIEHGNTEIVKKLVEGGYGVNIGSTYGMTPMLLAVFHGHRDIVDLFIKKGVNFVDFYRDDTMTRDVWQSLLHVAAAGGHVEVAKLLIDSDRFDRTLINKRDGKQNTALHMAAAGGHIDMVRLLLDAGFDPTLKGANEKLAIGYANQGGHKDIVELLQERMAPKPAPDRAPEPVAEPAPARPVAALLRARPEDSNERWKLVSSHSVALVTEMKELGYRITEIFNFESRERLRIVNNLKTKADNVEATAFAQLPDRAQLEEAFNAFTRQGGRADASALDIKVTKPRHLQLPPGPNQ